MNPPTMAGWNLALRFALELAALVGFGALAWKLAPGPTRWAAVIVAPSVVAAVWATFNVIGDPSRSGAAPVEVAGWLRLAIELLILGGGAAAFAFAGRRDVGLVLAALVVLHYACSWSRINWLIRA